MKKYDVIIVGCGPAGVGAAKVLKDNNISFCMIDKNKFPREKLCGGGLTHKSTTILKELKLNLDGIKTRKCREVEFISKSAKSNMILFDDIVMIDRLEFDYAILKQVVNNNLFELENITDIKGNILTTNKDTYEFKYIIFADGVNGYSRRFINDMKLAFCVEYESNIKTDKIILDFSLGSGYGWIFPKKDSTTIGVGNSSDERMDYIKALCNLAEKYNFKIDKSKIKGYHLPEFSKRVYKKSVINDKYILVGDAASIVDRVSGEGIYYALTSGKIAAESVIECLNSNKKLKEVYFKKFNGVYKVLKKRKRESKFLYSKHGEFFIRLVLNNERLTERLKKSFG